MRTLGMFMLVIGMVACGPTDSAPSRPEGAAEDNSAEVSRAVEETIGQALKGEDKPAEVSEETCAMLENGVVPEMFAVSAGLVSYKRSIPSKRAGHVVCSAMWDNPDKAELESAYIEKVQEWGRGKATGKKEPMPKLPRLQNRVSITLVSTRFDTAAAAVASLEVSVKSLQQGIKVNVASKEHETQIDFGNWIDGLGDKAIFTERDELLVAANGKRFAVMVEVADDAEVNRKHAIALAGNVIKSL